MATGIADLGTNVGYIYKVGVDKTTIIQAYPNTPENARNIKVEGLRATSSALNRKPYGTITVDTVTGVGTITSLLVGAWDIIGATIPYTGATSTSALATLIKDGINSFNNGSGHNYTATVSANVVTIIGEESLGADDNGAVVSVNNTGLSTYTAPVISGGSDASEVYDTGIGWTFFINADYDATGCSGSGTASPDSLTNAIEITDDVVPRSLNSALDVQAATIATGAVTLTRKSAISIYSIDTQGAAATDDLDTISALGYANGDVIYLTGENVARVVTVKSGTGNITLQGANDFVSADNAATLTLSLEGSTWYEVSRSTQSIGSVSDYRAAGYGFFGLDTLNSATILNTGTTTFNADVSSKYQKLTGGVTLAGNTIYALGTGVNGDEISLELDATVVAGAFSLTIFGITLTTEQALNGGLIFTGKYVSGAWQSTVSLNVNDGATNTFQAGTEFYKAASVTAAKVETALKTELITRRVSFESGEECDNQITMYYPGSVVDVYFSVDKVIAGTDNGTITPKNNAGVAMTGGLITATAAAALDTIFGTAATISANNTFIDGDVLNFTSAKTTKGGFGTLSIRVLKS